MLLDLWRQRFRDYLQERHYGERTVSSYAAELRPFFDFLDGCGPDSLSSVTRAHLEAYRTQLYQTYYRGHRLSASTQAYRLAAIKTFFGYLYKERFILVNPSLGLEFPRVPKPLPRVLLTEEEVRQVLEAPNVTRPYGIRDRAVLEVLYGTAIRNSELRRLTLPELDLERREVRLLGSAKGSKSRCCPWATRPAPGWRPTWTRSGRTWSRRPTTSWCSPRRAAGPWPGAIWPSWCSGRRVGPGCARP